MKKIKRSLFFNLFLVSIVIMNIAAFVSWRNEKMKMDNNIFSRQKIKGELR